MKSNSNREILQTLLADNGPFDVKLIPVPESREKLEEFLSKEAERFVAVQRIRGRNDQRDRSR